LEVFTIIETSHLQPIRMHLEPLGGRVTYNRKRFLLAYGICSVVNIINNLPALFNGLLVISDGKNNCLPSWCCRLRMVGVKKALPSAEITNVQSGVQVGFFGIGKQVAYCVIAMVANGASKILHGFTIMYFDNGHVVGIPRLEVPEVVVQRSSKKLSPQLLLLVLVLEQDLFWQFLGLKRANKYNFFLSKYPRR
jgi:hypothetical protein